MYKDTNAYPWRHIYIATKLVKMCIRDSSLMMAVDGTAETSSFAENIGLQPNSPGRNFNNKLLPCCR